MNHDFPPEHDRALEAVADAFVERSAALDRAVSRADLSGTSIAELHQLLGLVSATEEAIVRVLVAVDAANRAS